MASNEEKKKKKWRDTLYYFHCPGIRKKFRSIKRVACPQAERDQPSSCPRDYSKRHRRHVHPVDHDHAASDHHQQALHGQRTQVQYPPLPTFFSLPPPIMQPKAKWSWKKKKKNHRSILFPNASKSCYRILVSRFLRSRIYIYIYRLCWNIAFKNV